MKINLNIKIKLVVQEDGVTKDELEIFYRNYTKAEKKELNKIATKFQKMYKKATALAKKIELIDKKIEVSEKIDSLDRVWSLLEQKEKLDEDVEKLDEELEKMGGDNFEEEMAKKRFELLVSGNDKEKLKEYAETIGYSIVLTKIELEKVKIEKKLHGELPTA